ncbi:MAG: flagellar motor protein [Dehalococcoidia bacterium]
MDIALLVGLGLAAGGVLGGYLIEGGAIGGLINAPGFLIVIVGTFGAVFISFPLEQMLGTPKAAMAAIFNKVNVHGRHMAAELVTMADKARKEGLLSLEDEAGKVEDGFARKALMLMIDGTDPDALRSIMEIDIDSLARRHRENAKVFEAAGGFAPTLGVLGAVMGLISVLSNLGGDTAELGHGIATAFVATFYGVGFANVICLPIAEKLKYRSAEERVVREMILEGVLSIQAGDNPRIVKEKLEAFLAPGQRSSDDSKDGPASQAAAA